jgi:type IV secretion system protein VirD4
MRQSKEWRLEDWRIPATGIYFGQDRNGQYWTDHGEASKAVFAYTGTGKDATFGIPNLLSGFGGQALVCNDPKLESYLVCAKQLRRLGRRVFKLMPFPVLNFEWPHEDAVTTDYFNPLLACPAPGEPNFENSLYSLGEATVYPDGGPGYFVENARSHWVGCMAATRGMKPDLCNLVTAWRMAVAPLRSAEKQSYLRLMMRSRIPLAVDAAKPYLAGRKGKDAEATRGDEESLSTLRTQLQFLSIPEFQRVLSGPSSFHPSDVKKPDFALFIGMPAKEALEWPRFSRLINAALLDVAVKPPRADTIFYLNEIATSLGGRSLKAIETAANLARGAGCKLCCLFQNIKQVSELFGDRADSFLSAMETKMFFTPNDESTAGWIERRAGVRGAMEVNWQENYGYQHTGRIVPVPVLPAHLLYAMSKNQAVVYRAGYASGFRVFRKPFWERPELACLASANPYAPPGTQQGAA